MPFCVCDLLTSTKKPLPRLFLECNCHDWSFSKILLSVYPHDVSFYKVYISILYQYPAKLVSAYRETKSLYWQMHWLITKLLSHEKNRAIWHFLQHRFDQFATLVHFSLHFPLVTYIISGPIHVPYGNFVFCFFPTKTNFNTKFMVLFQTGWS